MAKGGRVVAGGKRHALGGSFYEPTVIADAKPEMKFMHEEIFGPVAPVFRFETEEEAISWPTTPNSASRPISTPAASVAPSASWRA